MAVWETHTDLARFKELISTWHRWLNSTAGGNETSSKKGFQSEEILTTVTVGENRF